MGSLPADGRGRHWVTPTTVAAAVTPGGTEVTRAGGGNKPRSLAHVWAAESASSQALPRLVVLRPDSSPQPLCLGLLTLGASKPLKEAVGLECP